MSNLPTKLPRHTVFRDNEYSHTFVFPDGYAMPAQANVSVRIRKNAFLMPGVVGSAAIAGQRLTITYTKETLNKIPGLYAQEIVFDGKTAFAGQILTTATWSEGQPSESQIVIEGENTTVVEIENSDQIADITEQLIDTKEDVENALEQIEENLNDSSAFLMNENSNDSY